MRACTIAAVVLFAGQAWGEPVITYKTNRPGNEIIYGCPIIYMLSQPAGMVRMIFWECAHPGKPFVPMGGTSYALWRHRQLEIRVKGVGRPGSWVRSSAAALAAH